MLRKRNWLSSNNDIRSVSACKMYLNKKTGSAVTLPVIFVWVAKKNSRGKTQFFINPKLLQKYEKCFLYPENCGINPTASRYADYGFHNVGTGDSPECEERISDGVVYRNQCAVH